MAAVDLELQLVLNVLPKHLKKVALVHLIQEAVLIQVLVVEQGLAGVDLGLVVLALHEYGEQLLGCLEREDPLQVGLLVVYVAVLLRYRDIVHLVERGYDLTDGHADVPDHFRSALFAL